VLAIVALAPATASAGGFEFSSAGTRALGRGGAFAARADDPMALLFNPAMLADLPDSQIHLSLHLAFWDACVERTGSYGDTLAMTAGSNVFDSPGADPDAWLADRFPRVCNGGYPQPIPDLVANIRISPEFGLAFGILAPAGIGNSQWGPSDGRLQTAGGLRPSPTRYGLVQSHVLLFHPSVGFGWRPVEWFRFGFTFQWGINITEFVNFTNSGMGPEDPFSDVRTQLNVTSPFVPAGILSVHFQPHPNLDIMASGRISDAIGGLVTASGSLVLDTSYQSTQMNFPPIANRIDGISLRAGQPWQFQLGIRYADRIRPRSWERGFEAAMRGVVDDSMYSENFDIELDVVYELNSQVGDFVITMPPGASVMVGMPPATVALHSPQPIPHGWPDILGFRLGGDWNIVPGQVAARAGFHTEIPLGQSRYQIHDFFTNTRFGLHLGATFRFDRFDLSIAYAHIFQLDMNITDGNFRGVAAQGTMGQCAGAPDYDPGRPVVSGGCYPSGYGSIANNGRYTSEYNVISLGGTYHFE
jgi:long-chain fatty acid transport protein